MGDSRVSMFSFFILFRRPCFSRWYFSSEIRANEITKKLSVKSWCFVEGLIWLKHARQLTVARGSHDQVVKKFSKIDPERLFSSSRFSVSENFWELLVADMIAAAAHLPSKIYLERLYKVRMNSRPCIRSNPAMLRPEPPILGISSVLSTPFPDNAPDKAAEAPPMK